MTVGEALRHAARRLEATSDTARLDAELLMAHTLGTTRSDMLLRRMNDAEPAGFAPLIDRRMRHEPVAYITGRQEFYGIELEVSRAVLIPRADSETLIEASRDAFAGRTPHRILDLGTGSGALLLAALSIWPQAEGIGLDSSSESLAIAKRNAQRIGSEAKTAAGLERRFLRRDWNEHGWQAGLGRFDLILANPPYVEDDADIASSVREWEPASALFAGPEGLDAYRILIPQLTDLLEPRGLAVLEVGATQARAVADIAMEAGFGLQIVTDLGNRPRALILANKGLANTGGLATSSAG